MDVTSPNPSTLKIEGGKLDVTKWRVTGAAAAADATIAVSGGTFTNEVPADTALQAMHLPLMLTARTVSSRRLPLTSIPTRAQQLTLSLFPLVAK